MEWKRREREFAHKKEKGWKFEKGRVKLRIGSVRVYVIPNKGQTGQNFESVCKITG
jgi:hypothetical protein